MYGEPKYGHCYVHTCTSELVEHTKYIYQFHKMQHSSKSKSKWKRLQTFFDIKALSLLWLGSLLEHYIYSHCNNTNSQNKLWRWKLCKDKAPVQCNLAVYTNIGAAAQCSSWSWQRQNQVPLNGDVDTISTQFGHQ
jgi:hypothetical protein